MGIIQKWSDFKAKRLIGQIEKSRKVLRNPKAIREDRQAALEFFSGLEDGEVAVESLLDRFEYSIENGITDSREKETAMDGITAHKAEIVLPKIRDRLNATTRIAWPIKVLVKMGKEQDVVEILQSCLDVGDISFDQAKVDKNYDILCYLRDFQISESASKFGVFMDNPDERVRFACCELLIEQQQDQIAIARLLERFILDNSAENTRIRQSVIMAFLNKGWKISSTESYPEYDFVPGIRLNKTTSQLVASR